MQKSAISKLAVWGAIAFCTVIVLLIFVYRPWAINWGATDDEIDRSMPGDEIVQSPTFNATRAVTIKAQPEEIWPWIVQFGYKRAGMYCYDWFDNNGIPSAESIIPEYQNLKVGDLIPCERGTVRQSHRIDRKPVNVMGISGRKRPLDK